MSSMLLEPDSAGLLQLRAIIVITALRQLLIKINYEVGD
jgi:hypothetical protein